MHVVCPELQATSTGGRGRRTAADWPSLGRGPLAGSPLAAAAVWRCRRREEGRVAVLARGAGRDLEGHGAGVTAQHTVHQGGEAGHCGQHCSHVSTGLGRERENLQEQNSE